MDGENILTEFWWEASSNELLRGSDILDDFEVFHAIPKLNVHLIELWGLVRLDILTENQEAPFNVGTYSMQAYPQVSEFESMLKEGLTDPAHLRELPLGVHSENRPNVEKLMKKKFVVPK
jgi:hypothetical protein